MKKVKLYYVKETIAGYDKPLVNCFENINDAKEYAKKDYTGKVGHMTVDEDTAAMLLMATPF